MQKWKYFLRETCIYSVSLIALRWLLFDEFDTKIVVESIFTGILLAWLTGTLGPRFARVIERRVVPHLEKSIPPLDLEDGELVLRDEGANHFKGIERVRGKLTLTNKRLLFRSHKVNIQNHTESISLRQIASVEKGKHSSGNVVRVDLKDGGTHFFGVVSPASWVETLSQQISTKPEGVDELHGG